MVDTWIARFETRLVWCNKAITDKKYENFVKRSLKELITNRRQRNWTIIFNILLVTCLWLGTMFFHSDGNTPIRRAYLKIISSGSKVESLHIFSIRILLLSWPCALLESRFWIILLIVSTESATVDKRFLVA